MTLVLKRGDRLPSLTATLTDAGVPVDLTTVQAIRAVGVRRGVTIFDKAVTGDENGVVVVDFDEGDTDQLGYIKVEFVVTWPNGKPQTFPPDGEVRVRVSLDGA